MSSKQYKTNETSLQEKGPCYIKNIKQDLSIMANFKDSQGDKDKYLDTSRKILSQVMLMCNMKALIFIKK